MSNGPSLTKLKQSFKVEGNISVFYLVLFSESEPYVEVETHSSSMRPHLRLRKIGPRNTVNYSNCYVANVVVPDGVVVNTPD